MPCYISETEGGRMFICGELGPHCAECADASGYLCDYPVGDGKTCDRPLCHTHANPIGPDLHYCGGHFLMWKEYKESGGVSRDLENVRNFGKPGNAGVPPSDAPRPVTAQEDRVLREAAKRSAKVVAPGKLVDGVDEPGSKTEERK